MEQPLLKQGESPPPPPPPRPRKKKLPSPRELVAHYESQGMDTQEASLKAIEDLQKVLFRMVTTTSKNKNKSPPSPDETSRKLDTLNIKLDSKPGYPQTLAIGLAAGALLHSATSVLPRVAGAVSQIWSSLGRASNSAPSIDG